MFEFDHMTKENIKEHNLNGPQISEHSYRMLIIGTSVSGKTNALLNLINHKRHADRRVYLFAKYGSGAKYQFLINKPKDADLKHLMILKLLWNTQMIWMIFMKTLKKYNTNECYCSWQYDLWYAS